MEPANRPPLIVAPVTLTLIILLCTKSVTAQISPGPLSRAHQSLSGPLQCTSCHKLAAGSGIFRCSECHTDIAHRLSLRRGYHAAVVSPTSTDKDCVTCHSEHNGENFLLIHWEPSQKAFDHRKTGYGLEGKHADLSCEQCHKARNIPEPERASIKKKDLNRTFLGLSRECLSCHTDQHRGQLGKDCLRCHTLIEWKRATGFDHTKTKFPLIGIHVRVACEKCHKPLSAEQKAARYVGLPFEKCSSCHTDPHRGSFKANCESCHNTVAWKKVSWSGMSAIFDHSRTDYPLLGKHANMRCSACHQGEAFNVPLAHGKCADCHAPDPHRGQFHARQDGGACEACHTVEGFKAVKFGVAEHATTTYPLEGRHAAVPCAKCHVPAGPRTNYRIKHTQCLDCHADIHKGQFASPRYNNRCESCHTVKGFTPSTFPLSRHSTTRFPLSGGHVAVACFDCHQARKPPDTSLSVPYRFDDISCVGCHVDPHNGQFSERMKKPGPDGKAAGCEACHSTKAWTDIVRFDHAISVFPLVGAHRAVPCASCHKPPNLELTMKNVVFTSASTRCEGCHEDPHANQFARDGRSPGCAECHNTNKWKPSLFDHETRTDFPLRGGHLNVRCDACHKTARLVEEGTVLFYKPTPHECAVCHGPA